MTMPASNAAADRDPSRWSADGRPSPRSAFAVLLVVTLVLTVVVAPPAQAEQGGDAVAALPEPANPEARKLMIEGNEAYDSALAMTDESLRQRDLADAIELYRAGAAKEPTHFYTFLWNLGLAYRRAGNYQQAIHFYQNFIDRAPKQYAAHRAAAAKHIADMRKEMERDAMLAEPSAPAPAPLRDPSEAAPTAEARLDPPAVQPRRPWYRDRVTLGLGAGGAVATIAGGVLGWRGAARFDDAATEPTETKKGELRADGRTSVIFGGVVGGVGVAILAVTVIRIVSPHTRRESTRPVQVSVGRSWIGLQGSF